MTRREVALVLLASGCVAEPGPPSLPVRVVIAADVPEEDALAWEAAAAEWNAALPRDAVTSVSHGELVGCGIQVSAARGMAAKDVGHAAVTSDCRVVVMMEPCLDAARRRVAALHELGHVLQGEWGHSADWGSVMHRYVAGAEQAILPADVARVVGRLERGW